MDRNNLVLDLTCRGTDKQRTAWNYVLLERPVAVAYARLLQALTEPHTRPGSVREWLWRDGVHLRADDFYRLFPRSPRAKEEFWGRVALPVFNLLAAPGGLTLPVRVGDTDVVGAGLDPTLNPPEEKRTYSTVYRNDGGHRRSMLHSPQGWSANENKAGQWVWAPSAPVLNPPAPPPLTSLPLVPPLLPLVHAKYIERRAGRPCEPR